VASAVRAIGDSVSSISALLRAGPDPEAGIDPDRTDAQDRTRIRSRTDEAAHGIVLAALKRTGQVAAVVSENQADAAVLAPSGPVAVAVDPLDGSANVELGLSGGTIFGVYPAHPEVVEASFLRPGRDLVAAGYAIYGPHTVLVVSVGAEARAFRLDPGSGEFVAHRERMDIPQATARIAINVSNYRHWDEPVRTWVDHCFQGDEGPRGKDFKMHWIGSLVPEAHQILSAGGVYLYPRDARPGYEGGRVRYLYEAAPIAYLVEKAGGGATDGVNAILDRTPRHLHQRTPFIFGSSDKVERIVRYHTDPDMVQETSPLFGRRGLFRS
jgi:fructose-1,6-bisphosphatase I